MGKTNSYKARDLQGFLHEPDTKSRGGLALTHSAGGNCEAQLLVRVAEAFSSAGWTVLRYNLPFRQKRPGGPPPPHAAAGDQAGILAAVKEIRKLTSGPIVAAGHSYGGRQTTMLAAKEPALCEAVLALSYPLHPPNKPEQLRTEHFAELQVPVLFVSGSKDAFGTREEMLKALSKIPARTQLVTVDSAGHDLKAGKIDLATLVVSEIEALLLPTPA